MTLNLHNVELHKVHPQIGDLRIVLKNEREASVIIGKFTLEVDNWDDKRYATQCEIDHAEVYIEYRDDVFRPGWYPRLGSEYDYLMSVVEVNRDAYKFMDTNNRRLLAWKICSWLNENWHSRPERDEALARKLCGDYLAWYGDRMRAIEQAALCETRMDEFSKKLIERFGPSAMDPVNEYLIERGEIFTPDRRPGDKGYK